MSSVRSVVGLIAVFALVVSSAVTMQWSAKAQEEVTIDDIIESPDDYVGQTVTVTGEITVMRGAQAFTLQGEQDPVGDETLLVVAAQENIPDDLDDGMTVTVTGEVTRVDPNDATQFEDIGLDPEDEALAVAEDDPVIIAESITMAQEGTPVASPEGTPGEGTPDATPADGTPTTPGAQVTTTPTAAGGAATTPTAAGGAATTPTTAPGAATTPTTTDAAMMTPTGTGGGQPGMPTTGAGGMSDGGTSWGLIAAVTLLAMAIVGGSAMLATRRTRP